MFFFFWIIDFTDSDRKATANQIKCETRRLLSPAVDPDDTCRQIGTGESCGRSDKTWKTPPTKHFHVQIKCETLSDASRSIRKQLETQEQSEKHKDACSRSNKTWKTPSETQEIQRRLLSPAVDPDDTCQQIGTGDSCGRSDKTWKTPPTKHFPVQIKCETLSDALRSIRKQSETQEQSEKHKDGTRQAKGTTPPPPRRRTFWPAEPQPPENHGPCAPPHSFASHARTKRNDFPVRGVLTRTHTPSLRIFVTVLGTTGPTVYS